MKKQIALKVLLPIFVILLIILLILEIKCSDIHNDSENGLLYAIAILLNIIPMIAMIILGIASVVLFVLLLALKNKKTVIKCTFIILCVFLPFVGFNTFIDITALHIFLEVPIMAVAVLAVNIVAVIICGMALKEIDNSDSHSSQI